VTNSEIITKINTALKTQVANSLGLDPKELNATAFENGIVTVTLGPACHSCSGGFMALVQSIEAELKEQVPVVEIVEAILA
jgi:Fe-S cluster biogenesis protein NfuA